MKVLHVTNAYPNEEYPIKGIFIKEQIDSLRKYSDLDITIYVINGSEGVLSYLKAWCFLIKNRNNYDIYHCHHVLTGLLALFSFLSKKNVIISYMNDGANNVKGRLRFLGPSIFRLLFNYFPFGIIKSSQVSDESKRYIPNGVNIDFFDIKNREEAKKNLGLDEKSVYILFVSANKIRDEKRKDLFDEIIKICSQKGYSYKPLIVTNAHRDTIPLIFNAASCYLLCSDFEGSPNALKECLSVGTPVVSRDVGNVRDMLKFSGSNFIWDADDLDEAANKLINAVEEFSDVERRKFLRQQVILQKLDINSTADKIVHYYREILNR